MIRMIRSLLVLLAAVPLMSLVEGPVALRPGALADVRGMTVSAPRAGQSWGSDAMVETMRGLRELGVNWIAIHPYGSIRGDGEVGGLRLPLDGQATWLTRPIEEAHRLGLKIMIKPHLAYWHSPFPWRGAIRFETDEEWERFFTTYTQWITRLAEVCAGADAFVVGTELDATIRHEQRWRAIIEAVRARTAAPLTYAANWDSYTKVPFWDALDAIGVQAYFPLVDHDRPPDPGELALAWRRIAGELAACGRRHDRPVLLTELGYDRSETTARHPWEDTRNAGPDAEPNAEEVQRRCLTAALATLAESDGIAGVFLWKWFPGEIARGSHLMSTPAMREVIASRWRPNPVAE